MAAALLPDPLWDLVEPFLPTTPRRPKGGRPRVSDRACLTGIVFVLRSGVPWQMLPQELGCGSGMTCWRRLRDWQQAGVWDLIHFALLDWLARDDQIDWSRSVVDSCSIRAGTAATRLGRILLIGPSGSKRHLLCDGRGVPLAVRLTGANRNDSQEALALVDAIPPLHGERGRPRQRPDCVLGDRGYDAAAIRRGLRARHIVPWIAMRRTAHGSGLGRWRWVVERMFAWLNQFRRLRVRYDKRALIGTDILPYDIQTPRCSMLSTRTVSIVILLALSFTFDNATAQDQSAQHSVYPLSRFQPGQWVEKVSGDFTKPGDPFVFRIHQDAGYITLPHTHPIDENITVVKGSWSLGMGRRFNRAALEPMDTGTFGIAPKNMAHFAWSKTETILQIHGIGPFASTIVEPVYELTDQGIFSLTSLLLPGRPTSSNPPDCFALKVNAKVLGEFGEGVVVGARCSPSNQITQYWVQKANGERFWASLQELKIR